MAHPSCRSGLWRVLGSVFGAAAAGCLSSEDINLGRQVEAGTQAPPNPGADGGSTQVESASLGATIEAPTGTICSGACVDLLAVGTGGAGAYTYSWGQNLGGGPGPKQVCPTTSTTYSVTIGASSSDIVSNATLLINVIACDGGTLETGPDADTTPPSTTAQDASTAEVQGLCVSNPSFEGPPVSGPIGPPGTASADTPPDWQECMGAPSVNPTVSLLPANEGKSYVGLPVGSGTFSDLTSSIGTTVCSPLQPGVEYSFCVDLGVAVGAVTAPEEVPAPDLELWGGTNPCELGELLWTSPAITNADSWSKECASFFPTQAISNIVLVPSVPMATGMGSWSYVIVDNIVAGP